jgi:hypothetical protein
MNIRDMFKKHMDEEFCEFHKIPNSNKQSYRPDICGFLLLDRLPPGTGCLVDAAEHDQIWLDIDIDELGKGISEQQVIELLRCNIFYDSRFDRLSCFV